MIGKFEANKDLIQELTTSGARRVGNIASIVAGTVQEVTREIGEWITDAIEMNEAAAAARRDAAAQTAPHDVERPDEASDRDLDAVPDPAPGYGEQSTASTIVDAEVVDPGNTERHR
ncbi:hypothetical protein [Nocardia donostiensis]|uniref:Uncharacterized protein n=1 Tax=Nocardia donostiensis TaxID=1538463 RepID=A0A1V2TCU7_9NOCA|nr:hypothetical protein [Nocardia donostiensis]ONM47329.1 hypothetical protein B0T46_18880 [Nocardia donostiensis]OQS16631.1 hypothetical protein B0T36_02830 [Nocardia donostiensis]OQS21108.1 hypothetical protein B0T44_08810 [Nocardia donostiensis]